MGKQGNSQRTTDEQQQGRDKITTDTVVEARRYWLHNRRDLRRNLTPSSQDWRRRDREDTIRSPTNYQGNARSQQQQTNFKAGSRCPKNLPANIGAPNSSLFFLNDPTTLRGGSRERSKYNEVNFEKRRREARSGYFGGGGGGV